MQKEGGPANTLTLGLLTSGTVREDACVTFSHQGAANFFFFFQQQEDADAAYRASVPAAFPTFWLKASQDFILLVTEGHNS